MWNLLFIAAAGLTLAACTSPGASREMAAAPAATVSDAQAFAAAKTALLASLKDPDSAKLSDMRRSGSFVCGRVNSKNGFGGYAGNGTFSVDSAGEVLIAGESVGLAVWSSPCWREMWEQR